MCVHFRCLALSKKTLKSVKKSGNEAIIQVKGNQPKLLQGCELVATKSKKGKFQFASKNKSRNRIEKRKVETFTSLKDLPKQIKKEWGKYLKMIIKVTRRRKEFNTKEKRWIKSHEVSYYISTINLTARESAKAVRQHWSIENRNHYVRDVAMREDKSRIRVGADMFVRLRSFSLNILRANKVENISQELCKNAFNIKRIFRYTKGI